MVAAYSIDLRERVIEYVESGGSKAEACRIYKIDDNTLYRWLKRKKQRGNLQADIVIRKPRKLTESKVLALVESNPEATLKEYAKELGVTSVAVFYAFKKLGITRKKNRSYIRKETKKNDGNFKKK
jgi:putative transposase